jgi:hypothetical protein
MNKKEHINNNMKITRSKEYRKGNKQGKKREKKSVLEKIDKEM